MSEEYTNKKDNDELLEKIFAEVRNGKYKNIKELEEKYPNWKKIFNDDFRNEARLISYLHTNERKSEKEDEGR